jgi:hypothetical protein
MPITQSKLSESEMQKLIQLARATQWQYRLTEYEDEALKEIYKSINRARREISNRLLIDDLQPWEKDRLNHLADELQDMTLGIQAQLVDDISTIASITGAESYLVHNDILSYGGRAIPWNNVSLSAEQLKQMAVKTPIGAYKLNEWVESSFDSNFQQLFKSEIMTGMLQGEGYKDLVKRFDIRAFKGIKQDIETITRSYVQTVNTEAALNVAKSNRQHLKGWKWSSATENGAQYTKTGKGRGRGLCLRCLALDAADKIYPLDGGPDLPAHPRCRCVRSMVTKTFREMGIDIDEIEEAYRPYSVRGLINEETGEIMPQNVGTGGRNIITSGQFTGNYEAWLKTQNKSIQVQTLGPKRWAMWNDGNIKLGDLVDKQGNLRLVKELQAGEK